MSVEVLALQRDVLGKKHPNTIRSMADLATAYHTQGRYNEAEKMLQCGSKSLAHPASIKRATRHVDCYPQSSNSHKSNPT
jgi:cytochrome c-type biogenesis protein CcmH/NrfG